ncbi:MAG: hypothetical protein PVF45_11070 [Anaerolineae bacterium]|jgi:hypothetical protein
MPYLFAGLLLTLLVLFFGLESIARSLLHVKDVKILGISLLSPGTRALLGAGVVLCEIAIIATFTNVLETVKDVFVLLRKGIKLLPLLVFIMAVGKTFWPAISNVTHATTRVFGLSQGEPQLISQVVNDGTFMGDILLTLAAMLFVAITNWAFHPRRKSD